ncbi:MAG: YihY/virulence factor BrkB family protein [Chitinophagales bacterium]|nr:YihY/virulence factor BrkB family protein [Chitinophagales bacterium]
MSVFKRLTLPGFERVPIHKVLGLVIREIRSPIMILRAKAIAYSFFLAIFPSIVFLFSLLSYLPKSRELTENILGYLNKMSPNQQMIELFKPIIHEVMNGPKGGILSIGFLLIIFFMKNGVVTMMQSFNVHFEIRSGKLFIKNQLLSIVITIVVLVLFVLTIVLLVLGKFIMQKLFDFFSYDGHVLVLLIDLLRYSISITLNFLVISILYYLGPIVRPERFKVFTPGSIVATTMIVLVSVLFSYYIKNFGNYNKIYGSLGVLIFMLIWLYWNALAILIGYEMNRGINMLKSKRRKK